jgi:hypothetical protein
LIAAARWSLALAAAATLAACSIEGRSAGFACQEPADCPDGRICESGWCVVGGGGTESDAATSASDAAAGSDAAAATSDAAPAVCSEDVCDVCDNGTCVFLCIPNDSCPERVECPPGMPCRVVCDGNDSCAAGVDCTKASACDIQCTDTAACDGLIACGPGRCEVVCGAQGTCQSGIDCADSCACDTRCSGNGACPDVPSCPAAECVEQDDDCTDNGAACDTCG